MAADIADGVDCVLTIVVATSVSRVVLGLMG